METNNYGPKKFFRDPDGKKIGGVCQGLATYANMDVTLLRLLFVIGLFFIGGTFWVYIIICLIAPEARTPKEKCELRGWAQTPENLAQFK